MRHYRSMGEAVGAAMAHNARMARRPARYRSIYVNGCPVWECGRCGDRQPPGTRDRAAPPREHVRPEHRGGPVTGQPDELDHLLDRMLRGVLLPEEADRLRTLVGHLVAGQCTDQLAVCQAHHLPPVAGCPYPRCRAARATGRAATA